MQMSGKIDPQKTKNIARLANVLSVETRVKIVALLRGRRLCVNAIASQLEISSGAVSQHLRIMRDADLVVAERCGYYVHYKLNRKTIETWHNYLRELLAEASEI